jgi:hypothetical protein
MISKLKILLFAAMAIMALSAVAATAAQAETEFKVTTGGSANITTTPDGTGTAAHYVFVAPLGNGATTCSSVDFKGTVTDGATSVTVESNSGVAQEPFTGCTFLGGTGFLKLNGCSLTFKGNGSVVIGNFTGKNCATEPIEFGKTSCIAKIGPQTVTGVTYTNVGTAANMEITMSTPSLSVNVTMSGAGCVATGTGAGTYSTGNTLITGLKDPLVGSEMTGVTVN